jgi:hypothetical protein
MFIHVSVTMTSFLDPNFRKKEREGGKEGRKEERKEGKEGRKEGGREGEGMEKWLRALIFVSLLKPSHKWCTLFFLSTHGNVPW